jgi:hypothetical protein
VINTRGLDTRPCVGVTSLDLAARDRNDRGARRRAYRRHCAVLVLLTPGKFWAPGVYLARQGILTTYAGSANIVVAIVQADICIPLVEACPFVTTSLPVWDCPIAYVLGRRHWD